MSTEVLGLPHGRALTRPDLDTMPDDGHRYELIDGVLIVSPAPLTRHQIVVGELFAILRDACSPELRTMFAPVDVVLGDATVIQPDVLVAAKSDFTDVELPGPPLLAVEVLSPSTRTIDLTAKKALLAHAGCPHYWVVDPDGPSIVAWTLRDGEYAVSAEADGPSEFTVTDPVKVSFSPQSLIN